MTDDRIRISDADRERVAARLREHFAEGRASEIYRRAREHGRQLPPGLDYLDSWVDLEYRRCFQLMRTDDPGLFEQWIGH